MRNHVSRMRGGIALNTWYWSRLCFSPVEPRPVQWWLDLLLIDTLVRDVLSAHSSDFVFWRFHRRAGGDAGHQFSLIWYAPLSIHPRVEQSIREHEATRRLMDEGLLRELRFEDRGGDLGSMSDGNWPTPLQEAWPHYIMGSSRMMLDLTDRLRTSPRPDLAATQFSELESYYTQLMASGDQLWVDWGQHAFLHHLNALAGYEPLFLRPRYRRGNRYIL